MKKQRKVVMTIAFSVILGTGPVLSAYLDSDIIKTVKAEDISINTPKIVTGETSTYKKFGPASENKEGTVKSKILIDNLYDSIDTVEVRFSDTEDSEESKLLGTFEKISNDSWWGKKSKEYSDNYSGFDLDNKFTDGHQYRITLTDEQKKVVDKKYVFLILKNSKSADISINSNKVYYDGMIPENVSIREPKNRSLISPIVVENIEDLDTLRIRGKYKNLDIYIRKNEEGNYVSDNVNVKAIKKTEASDTGKKDILEISLTEEYIKKLYNENKHSLYIINFDVYDKVDNTFTIRGDYSLKVGYYEYEFDHVELAKGTNLEVKYGERINFNEISVNYIDKDNYKKEVKKSDGNSYYKYEIKFRDPSTNELTRANYNGLSYNDNGKEVIIVSKDDAREKFTEPLVVGKIKVLDNPTPNPINLNQVYTRYLEGEIPGGGNLYTTIYIYDNEDATDDGLLLKRERVRLTDGKFKIDLTWPNKMRRHEDKDLKSIYVKAIADNHTISEAIKFDIDFVPPKKPTFDELPNTDNNSIVIGNIDDDVDTISLSIDRIGTFSIKDGKVTKNAEKFNSMFSLVGREDGKVEIKLKNDVIKENLDEKLIYITSYDKYSQASEKGKVFLRTRYEDDEFKEMTLKQELDKNSYVEGEKLDLSGLKLKLIDNNGNWVIRDYKDYLDSSAYSKLTIDDKEVDGRTKLNTSHNDKELKIHYKGVTITNPQNILVTGKPIDKENIASIEILNNPKLEYKEYQKMDYSNVRLKLKDSNNVEVEIGKDDFEKYGITVSPEDNSTIMRSQNGNKVSFTINDISKETDESLKVLDADSSTLPTELAQKEAEKKVTAKIPEGVTYTEVKVVNSNGDTIKNINQEDVVATIKPEEKIIEISLDNISEDITEIYLSVREDEKAFSKTGAVSIDIKAPGAPTLAVPDSNEINDITISDIAEDAKKVIVNLGEVSDIILTKEGDSWKSSDESYALKYQDGKIKLTLNNKEYINNKTIKAKVVDNMGNIGEETSVVAYTVFDNDSIKAVEVAKKPNLTYIEKSKFDISGMEVKLIDKNNNYILVKNTDFASKNITINLEDGTVLEVSDNDREVTVALDKLSTSVGKLSVTERDKTSPITEVKQELKNIKAKIVAPENKNDVVIKLIDDNGKDIIDKEGSNIVGTVDENGNIDIDISNLSEDKTSVKIFAKDGDKTEAVSDLITLDFIAPNKPTIEITKKNEDYSIKISNVDDDVDKIEVKIGDKKINLTKVESVWKSDDITYTVSEDGKGIYLNPSNNVDINDKDIVVKVTDTVGNISEDTDAVKTYTVFDENKVTGIEIVNAPKKFNYIEGEIFDLLGLTILATDENGNTKRIDGKDFEANGVTVDPNGELSLEDNGKVVTFTYKDKVVSTTDKIIVKNKETTTDSNSGKEENTGNNTDNNNSNEKEDNSVNTGNGNVGNNNSNTTNGSSNIKSNKVSSRDGKIKSNSDEKVLPNTGVGSIFYSSLGAVAGLIASIGLYFKKKEEDNE